MLTKSLMIIGAFSLSANVFAATIPDDLDQLVQQEKRAKLQQTKAAEKKITKQIPTTLEKPIKPFQTKKKVAKKKARGIRYSVNMVYGFADRLTAEIRCGKQLVRAKVSETIPGGWKVASINARQVKIKKGKRSKIIYLSTNRL